ncbi:peptidoglycan-binding domain-containing protein [Pseudotabrizicola algicola]|uniref:Peptidoglycan-binding protein n=1 Tax=Pseudotabrizicola algicola TaxID=2709381 RepID=A0A6B3RMD4_9RHOB|nr:peptidoglycan-binding protein [Pseudotabrizicola algicola]NEX47210.1 peptidoglycan-binding protein [Pseudotabrizicola algicola]
MQKFVISTFIATSLALAAPATAQTDLSDIVSGVAKSLLAQELDQNAFREAQRVNTVAAYRSYLERFPNGTQRAAAERALARLGAPVTGTQPAPVVTPPATPPDASAASVEAGIGLTRAQRTTLQRQLTALGYPTGVADGLWGTNTRSAIQRWQTANKLNATGYVTASQVRLIQQQAGAVAEPSPSTPANEDALEERLLSLTASERREVQRMLTRLGYNTGGVDGVFGRNTRAALAAWQRDEAVRASGYITADQLRELRRQTGA